MLVNTVSTLATESVERPMKHAGENPAVNAADFLLTGKDTDRAALLTLDHSYSYGQVQSAAGAVANYLIEQGGHKGDRVLLVSENSLFWISAYLGTLQAGLVCVPLPPATSSEGLAHIAQLTEPRFVFLQDKIAAREEDQFRDIAMVTDAKEAQSSGQKSFHDLLQRFPGKFADPVGLPRTAPGDLAALMFTSGSTGRPRGVKISHGNIIANTGSIIECLGLTQDDRIMAVLPFYYCFGASLLHTHLRTGGSVVIDSRFMYPDKVLQRMAETECTGFAGVPSHYQILLRKSSLPRMAFPHLRYVQQAGGHLAPVFVRELSAALPNSKIFLMYGQTEATARLTCLPPSLVKSKTGSIGKPIPGVRLRVLDASSKEVKAGCEGEIVAEGANIALGYWRDEAGTAMIFRQGQLHTGDIGTRDEEGFFYLTDRTRDFIKCGGERISCRNIEEQLLEFDELLEAAVVGVPDDVLGEAIQVFVVPRYADISRLEDHLRQFCKQNIPFKLMPKSIVILKSLPKNSAGKVLKPALRQLQSTQTI